MRPEGVSSGCRVWLATSRPDRWGHTMLPGIALDGTRPPVHAARRGRHRPLHRPAGRFLCALVGFELLAKTSNHLRIVDSLISTRTVPAKPADILRATGPLPLSALASGQCRSLAVGIGDGEKQPLCRFFRSRVAIIIQLFGRRRFSIRNWNFYNFDGFCDAPPHDFSERIACRIIRSTKAHWQIGFCGLRR
jgi:hypothetical protein